MIAVVRTLAGLAIATVVAVAARRSRSLSRGGALTAVVVGTVAVAAGWSWGAILLAFFVSSSALSRWRADVKELRAGAIVEKGGERDTMQVIANGGVFALGALLWLAGWSAAAPLAFGALAGAASDTWATEVGTLARQPPRSIVSWRPVPPGTSGGVTTAGLAAALAAAATLALFSYALGWTWPTAIGALAGGIAGSTADSLLGALLQAQRWCDRCNSATERRVHHCGTGTRRARGLTWLDNDAVNLAATVVGGVAGVLVWALARGILDRGAGV